MGTITWHRLQNYKTINNYIINNNFLITLNRTTNKIKWFVKKFINFVWKEVI